MTSIQKLRDIVTEFSPANGYDTIPMCHDMKKSKMTKAVKVDECNLS